ncbi:DNA repair protein RecO [Candidatus Peregrinibacteria bacterium]|nr:DNA repair protein RecO [Candidatus Peregrinibacteria bacterium]
MHPFLLEAVILKVMDIGEADRFCILLTRERGRMAVRAKAVRKLQSRMGGTLLPLRHVRVHAKEWSGGFLVTSAVPVSESHARDLGSFSQAEQGMELLLGLLEDGEPLPEVFDLTVELLAHRAVDRVVMLGFILRLLHLLGFLPESSNDHLFSGLSDAERTFVDHCRAGMTLSALSLDRPDLLERTAKILLADQLRSPLKVPGVAAAIIR